jgi:hypothetical protein
MSAGIPGVLLLATGLVLAGWGRGVLGADSCPAEVLSGCVGQIIPYEQYQAAFPVVQYCRSTYRGFIPVREGRCGDVPGGRWKTRAGKRPCGVYS